MDPRRAQAQVGNAKEQDLHSVFGKKGEDVTILQKDIKPEATLYIKGCEDSNIHFHGKCTKVMIEGCRRCKFKLGGKIITEIAEVWKCTDSEIAVSTEVKTLQLDICRNLKVNFDSRDHLHNVVWAGVYDMSLAFVDEPEVPPLITGFEQLKPSYPDLNPIFDQFYTRIVDKEILTEQVVRLQNGYPTTEREAKEFDEQKEKNAKNAEDFLTARLAAAGITLGKKKPKVPRNSPCDCDSGKKAKHCCHKD